MRGSKSARGLAQRKGESPDEAPKRRTGPSPETQNRTKPGNAEPDQGRKRKNPARCLAGFCVDAACELLLGLVWFCEAVHDAFELHRRGVRGGAPRRTGEGERMLRTWIGDVHHDDLARLQLREQDLLGQQIL